MLVPLPRGSSLAPRALAVAATTTTTTTTTKTSVSSISKFFSASPESLWATINETQPALVAAAQVLFDQITATRQAPLRSTSLDKDSSSNSSDHSGHDDKKLQHDKVWAVVAVVATAITQDLSHERLNSSSPRTHNHTGVKRRAMRQTTTGHKRKLRVPNDVMEIEGTSSIEEDEDYDNDEHDEYEPEQERDAARDGNGKGNGSGNGTNSPRRRDGPLPRWHLVDFLVEANVSMASFLENLTGLFDRLLLDPELLEVTTILKEEFTVATVLFEKYRFVWKKFALHSQNNTASPDRMELLVRIGWLLFLVIRRRVAGSYAGLGNLYYLMLAVVKLMISQVSPRSVEAEVAAALSALGGGAPADKHQQSSTAGGHASGSMDDQAVLEMLCSTPKVDQEEVNRAYDDVTHFVVQLVEEQTLVAAANGVENNGGTSLHDMGRTLRGVFAAATLRQNATQLFAFYARQYLTSCGSFDERVYLNEQSRHSLLGPRAPAVLHANAHESNNGESNGVARAPPTSNPLTSPVRRPMTPSRRDASTPSTSTAPPPSPFTVQAWQWHGSSPPPSLPRGLSTPVTRALGGIQQSPFVMQTPVTAAVEISSWIRDTMIGSTSGSPEYVSAQLVAFFQECTSDPTDHIADVLSEMSQKLLTSRRRARASAPLPLLDGGSRTSNDAGASTFSEVDGSLKKITNLAIALFYRVLEALLVSERGRLRTSNFSSLLNNETFLSSLFACSLEVGLKSHSLITLSFPFLLETVDVNAFDFGKVIESFVKHVPRLPSAMKRHMRDLEQMILDSLAWRSDSRLYTVLKGEKQPKDPQPQQAPAALLSTDTTPIDASTPTGTTATTTTTTTAAAPRTTVLQLFFRKVMSLAATRIFRLGSLLDLEATHMNQVWSAVKECLSSQLHLLKDRHLDQIILCSIYGVCKVNKLNTVTFNRIIDQYKKLQTPQWGIHGGSNGSSSSTGSSAPSAAHAAFASASLTRKSHDVIRDIKLDDHSRGDVIKFYNRCYIPSMKVFLLQYQAQDKQVAAAHAAVANATGTSRDAHMVTSSTSDSELVAEAAASAVEKAMQAYAPVPRTPVRASGGSTRPARSGAMGMGSPSARPLPMFTTAEVESLPVSVHQTSPKRVLASNVYMSPLQNAWYQQQRTHMTPRSHVLYAFGESPSRDLALINRAVNVRSSNGSVRTASGPPRLVAVSGGDSDTSGDATSGGYSNHTTPINKRRRT